MCIGSGMGAAAVFEAGGEADCLTNAAATKGPHSHVSRDATL